MAYEQIPQYKPTEHQTPEPKVNHSAPQDSLGVHPSEKKKEAIVPHVLQPESPHKNLPYGLNQPESPHKNLPPELKRSNPDPNAPELLDKLKNAKPFTFEKFSEKDTDPNAPKLPNKLREPVPFTLEKYGTKTTDPNAPKLEKPREQVAKDAPKVEQPKVKPAQPPMQQNSSPAMQEMKPSWQVPSSSVVFEKSPILWDNQAVANKSSPIIWSNNPQPVFGTGQSPVSQNAALTNPAQPTQQALNGKPAEIKPAQTTQQPGAEVKTAQTV
jgi:hypothetical protein